MTKRKNTLSTICRFTDPIQAHIVKGRLEAEGIYDYLANEHHIWAKWTISNALGGVELQVYNNDKKKELEIIDSIHAGEFEIEGDHIICEKCTSKLTKGNKLSYKISFFIFFTFGIPLPFSNQKYICTNCGYHWTISN